MLLTLSKHILQVEGLKVNAFAVFPSQKQERAASAWAIMSHGYTADKSSILNWAQRLASENCPALLFDLPGHYLGSFNEVEDIKQFAELAPKFFDQAYMLLQKLLGECPRLVLTGHSLGALLALKALSTSDSPFSSLEKRAVVVGLGHAPEDGQHLFETPLYKSTLHLRAQLVSPALAPQHMLPWIHKEKEKLQLNPSDCVHFISGLDDLVATAENVDSLVLQLKKNGARITCEHPARLPHHQPELAAGLIKSYLKKEQWL